MDIEKHDLKTQLEVSENKVQKVKELHITKYLFLCFTVFSFVFELCESTLTTR